MSTRAFNAAAAALIVAVVGSRAEAAISIGANGINNNGTIIDFAVTPIVGDWATGSISGVSSAINSVATMTTQVQTMAAAGITTALPVENPNNYAAGSTFKYQQLAQHLSSTGSAGSAGLLLATLANTSGVPILSFDALYDFGIQSAGNDDFPGFVMYYSTTGLASSWVLIGQHTAAGTQTATITPSGGWLSGTNLYLLWADDNSQANPDGAFTLDNFQVSNVVPEPGRAGLIMLSAVALLLRRRRR